MDRVRFLSYIEADGRQYIDTGVQVGSYTALYMRAKLTEPSTNWDTLFGTRDGNTRRFTARFGNAENGELQIQFSTNRNYTTGYSYWNTGARKNECNEDWMIVEMDSHAVFMGSTVEVTGYHYVHYKSTDGYKSWTQKSDTGGFGPYPASLYLFALHDKAEGAMDFAHMRLSYCKISGSGLNRAFYPALDENGRVCLYDAVSDSYFYSKGEADFIAGPEINRMLLRVLTRSEGEEPSFSLTRVESVDLPVAKYYAPAYTVQDTDIKEFVGYDTDEAAFTPVHVPVSVQVTATGSQLAPAVMQQLGIQGGTAPGSALPGKAAADNLNALGGGNNGESSITRNARTRVAQSTAPR